MIKVLGDFIGKKRRIFHVMDVNPKFGSNSEISARAAATRGLNFSSGSEYYLEDDNNKLKFNLTYFDKVLKNQSSNEPLIIFGFTYVLYFYVVKKLINKGKKFRLPVNTKIIHIGGWKKLESKKVSREKI